MSPRAWLNLGLLVLGVGLLLLAVYEPGRPPAPAPETVAALQRETIQRITLRRDDAAFTLARAGSGWRLAADPDLPADPLAVETLLRLPGARARRSYPASALRPADLGLGPAATRVIYDDRLELRLGATEALEGLRYVRNGDRIHLVTDHYATLVTAARTDLISRRLLPGDAALRRVVLPDGTALARADDGAWRLTPAAGGVSADALVRWAEAWRRARAVSLSPAPPGPAAADAPTIRVWLAGADQPIRFTVAARQPAPVLTRPDWGVRYHLAPGTATLLTGPGAR